MGHSDPHSVVDGRGRAALVTGSSGFKGGWLVSLLHTLGFEVTGWDRRPGSPGVTEFVQRDLRDPFEIPTAVDTVFHLAAQSLVPVGYQQPADTWLDNVVPTVNLLEACRHRATPLTVVVVTSDKVYTLPSAARPLVEGDELGGYCPYSSSKAAAELAVRSYRPVLPDHVRVITARAGNVIGGGDEAAGRLVPDVIRAAAQGVGVELRRPESTRPWLFVLDCLWGYVLAAESMRRGVDVGPALNFGPDVVSRMSAGELATALSFRLGSPPPVIGPAPTFTEAPYLELDSNRARSLLGWCPHVQVDEALDWIAEWVAEPGDDTEGVRAGQIERFLNRVGGGFGT